MRRCTQAIALVRSESCGIPLRLIPIEQNLNPLCIPIPCSFSPLALIVVTAIAEPLGSYPYQKSDLRRFQQSLNANGLLRCNDPIDRPDLWLQAMIETAPRNGEHFAEIYSNLLRAI